MIIYNKLIFIKNNITLNIFNKELNILKTLLIGAEMISTPLVEYSIIHSNNYTIVSIFG